LKRIGDLAKTVHAGTADDTPETLNTPGKRALYSNLKPIAKEIADGLADDTTPYNVAGDPVLTLALRLDATVKKNRPNAWRGVHPKEQVIKRALFGELKDAAEVERIFLIIKAQTEY